MPSNDHQPVTFGGIVTPRAGPVRRRSHARWALGTAVLGRPAYINTGSLAELPADRSVESFRDNTFRVLDAAVAAGVDWIDTARSYGRAEEFVGQWWRHRAAQDSRWAERAPTLSSKWGYRYVGDWNPVADVHEVKDHSLAMFESQLALTREFLPRLHLYQVHSLTLESPLFDDGPLLDALARLRDSGVAVGFSTSGSHQGETILRAMELTRAGGPVFSAVQATWNLLETSAGQALAVASRRELTVIVKEALANGRLVTDPPAAVLAVADKHGAAPHAVSPDAVELAAVSPDAVSPDAVSLAAVSPDAVSPDGVAPDAVSLAAVSLAAVAPDAVALAAVAAQPWVDRVLLGAASVGQLEANLRAGDIALDETDLTALMAVAEDPAEYWARRSGLPWR